jgi:hypothetical protein
MLLLTDALEADRLLSIHGETDIIAFLGMCDWGVTFPYFLAPGRTSHESQTRPSSSRFDIFIYVTATPFNFYVLTAAEKHDSHLPKCDFFTEAPVLRGLEIRSRPVVPYFAVGHSVDGNRVSKVTVELTMGESIGIKVNGSSIRVDAPAMTGLLEGLPRAFGCADRHQSSSSMFDRRKILRLDGGQLALIADSDNVPFIVVKARGVRRRRHFQVSQTFRRFVIDPAHDITDGLSSTEVNLVLRQKYASLADSPYLALKLRQDLLVRIISVIDEGTERRQREEMQRAGVQTVDTIVVLPDPARDEGYFSWVLYDPWSKLLSTRDWWSKLFESSSFCARRT